MPKPNLFIVGAPKCGTTAWYEYLRSHPKIFFPDRKEPHHFLTDFPEYPQVRDRDEYLRLFQPGASAPVIGEASPHYLFSNEAAKNIFDFNPGSRIIIFIRDPVSYLESLFNEYLHNGMECIPDFKSAWDLSESRTLADVEPPFKEPGLLNYHRSAEFYPQIERFFNTFPPDQIRVFDFSNWTRDPRQTYLEILRFVGLEDDGRTEFPPVNKAKHHRFPALLKLVQNPPPGVSHSVKFLRWLNRGRGLGVGPVLLRANSRPGAAASIEPLMRAELAEYFAEDVKLVQTRVWSGLHPSEPSVSP